MEEGKEGKKGGEKERRTGDYKNLLNTILTTIRLAHSPRQPNV